MEPDRPNLPLAVPARRRAAASARPISQRTHAARCRLAARLAAGHYRVPVSEVAGRRRGSRRSTHARHVAMYLAHVVYGLSLAVVAEGFHRDRTTAAYACARIEDVRDDPAFDAALAGLEITARVLAHIDGTAA